MIETDSFKDKHLWIKKATGIGVTEFFLRLMIWLCLKDNTYHNSQFCIVTGPNQDIAIKLIKRMKALFEPHNITFANKETMLELNDVKIEAFPSHHLDSMRGLPDVKFILLDEADFFPLGQQQDARSVSERYIGKSSTYLVMVSTPNNPEGLFQGIEQEQEETCIYKRLKLDWTIGLGKIYTIDEIEKAKQSPSFEREYNLKYLGLIGDVFNSKSIDAAIDRGRNIDLDTAVSYEAQRSIGLDPGWGSSSFGIVVTQWSNDRIEVLYADEFEKADFQTTLNRVLVLAQKFNVSKSTSSQIFIDAANPEFIRSLKSQMGERSDYELESAFYKQHSPEYEYIQDWLVVPIAFAKEHKAMLSHAKRLMEDNNGMVAIHSSCDKLITALRTAVAKEYTLDKTITSYDDIFDAFRLSLMFYH